MYTTLSVTGVWCFNYSHQLATFFQSSQYRETAVSLGLIRSSQFLVVYI